MEVSLELPDRLHENTVFQGLTARQIADMLPCVALAVQRYGPRECVVEQGQTPRGLGMVLDGQLELWDGAGEGKPLDIIGPGQLFGEAALASQGGETQGVYCAGGAQVLYLSCAFFLSPCGRSCANKEAHQKVLGNMLRHLSDHTLSLRKKIAYLTADDLKTKIAMYLCELCQLNDSLTFHMPLNRDRLADYFAVARPSLSRELTNLKSMGLIDFHRSSVTIADLSALRAMARGG